MYTATSNTEKVRDAMGMRNRKKNYREIVEVKIENISRLVSSCAAKTRRVAVLLYLDVGVDSYRELRRSLQD